jgi:phenylalanyl-tRNA synthetase beta chain
VDDGLFFEGIERDENDLIQVVCGAPNVHEGMLAVWIPPGATVPASVGNEPLVLDSRDIRGVKSNGMLASPKELALGDSHEGLLEIDKDVQPGVPFDEVYLLEDHVIDIENKMFTHRPDCFGALGVAREVAGILGHQFASPEWYRLNPEFPGKEADLPLHITNELPELVPRFSAVTIADIQLGPSPMWLQVALSKVGQKSINNIVDLTNFYMLVTGQPLHAYDYDKVKALTEGSAAEIGVRYPRPNEKIKLINGKEIEPREQAIMITSGNHLIGLGGVMGGFDTEVDTHTKNIILEAANFDMYNIRRTSMAHGLFTDAVTRFNKGQSPLQTVAVLAKITQDIQKMAGGKVASDLIDISQVQDRQWVHPPVPVTADFINVRLGLRLSADDMRTLLTNVEFTVDIEDTKLIVTAPFWRTDIETREDVVEEVGRLYGYDKLPLELPKRSIQPAVKNNLLELKNRVRESLVGSGANELLTYSFVHGDLLDKVGQDKEQAFRLGNALSPDLQYYRLSLTPSLLDKVHPNIKAGYDEFALFEIGKGHNLQHATDDDGLPMEFEMLDVVYANSAQPTDGAAFYKVRRLLTSLAADCGVALEFRPIAKEEDYPVVKPYDHMRSAQVFVKGTDMPLGMIGEYKASVRRNLKLPVNCAGFGIGLTQLLQAAAASPLTTYVELPKFPKVSQDITLKVPSTLSYAELYSFVWNELGKVQPQHTLPTLAPVGIYQASDDSTHKNITLRFNLSSYDKTLTDLEVAAMLEAVAQAAQAIDAIRV